jgi:DNA-binding transcriptional LysR family regulator
MLDWNDLRHFLAVAETGSTLAAARRLRVSQATVSRRIAVLEESLGTQLFVRSPSGYRLTPRGRAVLPAAETVAQAVRAFEAGIEVESRRLSGRVRLTTVESAANAWVIPGIARLREEHPEVSVEIVTTDEVLDLARGEADIAIRFGARPSQESLVVRHLIDLDECFYAHRELVTCLGRPTDYADLARYPLIAYPEDRLGTFAKWIATNIPEANIVQRANAMSSIIAAVRAGMGAAMLPTIMGDDIRDIVRLMPPLPLRPPCWLVTTDAARRQPHVRAVIDRVVEQVVASTQRNRPDEALSA